MQLDRRTGSASTFAVARHDAPAAGKRTLTEQLPAGEGTAAPRSAPIQLSRGPRPTLQELFGGVDAGTPVIQRRAVATQAPLSVPEVAASGGAPLDRGVRATMERSFGADFGSVRVHQDGAASAVGAMAYARGDDLHFAPGAYDPGSPSGRELIGHELAHVVQQRQGRASRGQAKGVAIQDDPALEREADQLGALAARGEPAQMDAVGAAGAPGGVVQRKQVWVMAGYYIDTQTLTMTQLIQWVDYSLQNSDGMAARAFQEALDAGDYLGSRRPVLSPDDQPPRKQQRVDPGPTPQQPQRQGWPQHGHLQQGFPYQQQGNMQQGWYQPQGNLQQGYPQQQQQGWYQPQGNLQQGYPQQQQGWYQPQGNLQQGYPQQQQGWYQPQGNLQQGYPQQQQGWYQQQGFPQQQGYLQQGTYPTQHVEPQHVEPQHVEPQHVEPQHVEPQHVEPQHVEPQHVEPQHVEPQHVEPQHVEPQHVEPQPTESKQTDSQHGNTHEPASLSSHGNVSTETTHGPQDTSPGEKPGHVSSQDTSTGEKPGETPEPSSSFEPKNALERLLGRSLIVDRRVQKVFDSMSKQDEDYHGHVMSLHRAQLEGVYRLGNLGPNKLKSFIVLGLPTIEALCTANQLVEVFTMPANSIEFVCKTSLDRRLELVTCGLLVPVVRDLPEKATTLICSLAPSSFKLICDYLREPTNLAKLCGLRAPQWEGLLSLTPARLAKVLTLPAAEVVDLFFGREGPKLARLNEMSVVVLERFLALPSESRVLFFALETMVVTQFFRNAQERQLELLTEQELRAMSSIQDKQLPFLPAGGSQKGQYTSHSLTDHGAHISNDEMYRLAQGSDARKKGRWASAALHEEVIQWALKNYKSLSRRDSCYSGKNLEISKVGDYPHAGFSFAPGQDPVSTSQFTVVVYIDTSGDPQVYTAFPAV